MSKKYNYCGSGPLYWIQQQQPPKSPTNPILRIPGIISRPDSRDSYPNIREKNRTAVLTIIFAIPNFLQLFFQPRSVQGIQFQGRNQQKE